MIQSAVFSHQLYIPPLYRNCIGQEFALNEELVVLSHILRKFVFTLDESHGPVTKYRGLILQPKPGVFLNLHHRTSCL